MAAVTLHHFSGLAAPFVRSTHRFRRRIQYTPERYSGGKFRNFPPLLSHVCPAALSFDGYSASAWNVPTRRATGRRAPRPPPTSPWKTSPALTPRATTCRSRASSPTSLTIAPSFLVYAGLYTAHLISAESSVTSIRSMNCAATIFFSSKLSSEKTSLSGMAGLDFSRLRDARISSRSFSRRASAR